MRYVIHGTPHHQERARAYILKGRIKLFDPKKSRDYKKFLKNEIKKLSPEKMDGALSVTFDIYVGIPKSYSKKKREEILSGELHPAKKPDLSNFIKLIEDAFNGTLWDDDAQIIEIIAKKHYSESPRIEIDVRKFGGL